MLDYLTIKGFAIIDELQLPFLQGLTVLTGETGAGKSIIVDALQAVLGERVDSGVVRTGEDSARVEAAFTVHGVLPPEGIDISDELVISREIRREGRGRASVNGTMITLAQLKLLGDRMVDFHGQHEHQSLLKTSVHLQALDSFASLERKRDEFRDVFIELRDLRERIRNIEGDRGERAARADYLRYVIKELESAGLEEGEEERLREEERILGAAEKLLMVSTSALEEIYQVEGSALETVRHSSGSLKQMMETDGRLHEVVELLEGAGVQLEEAGHFLRSYASGVQSDPVRLEAVGQRLAQISDFKKKYGPSLEDVIATLTDAGKELDLLEEGEEGLAGLRSRESELAARAREIASELSRERRRRAPSLELSVQEELAELSMEKVRFSVSFQDAEMGETGIDEAEFLISPNPGEPLMPLRKIASGGELSRVMLAVKRILAGAGAVPILVFDEVDAGIGGRVAAVLGRKLQDIAAHHQVLCITHLAPVAACAQNHLHVEKGEEGGRTVVRARYLKGDDRVEELARMMGGIDVSPGIIRSARELLEEARG